MTKRILFFFFFFFTFTNLVRSLPVSGFCVQQECVGFEAVFSEFSCSSGAYAGSCGGAAPVGDRLIAAARQECASASRRAPRKPLVRPGEAAAGAGGSGSASAVAARGVSGGRGWLSRTVGAEGAAVGLAFSWRRVSRSNTGSHSLPPRTNAAPSPRLFLAMLEGPTFSNSEARISNSLRSKTRSRAAMS